MPPNNAAKRDTGALLWAEASIMRSPAKTAIGAANGWRRVRPTSIGCLLLAAGQGKMGSSTHWSVFVAAGLWIRYLASAIQR
jgi:hypothetical protein